MAQGKDLLKSGDAGKLAADVDAEAAKHADILDITNSRHGPHGDEQLEEIMDRQGFNAHPSVVTREKLDELVAGGHLELHRGFSDDPETKRTAESFQNQFRHGSNYSGYGFYGNGIYTSESRSVATGYTTKHQDSAVLRMALHKDAKMIEFGTIQQQHEAFLKQHNFELGTTAHNVWGDVGRFAAAKGWDAIYNNSRGGLEVVVLNRTALFVQAAS